MNWNVDQTTGLFTGCTYRISGACLKKIKKGWVFTTTNFNYNAKMAEWLGLALEDAKDGEHVYGSGYETVLKYEEYKPQKVYEYEREGESLGTKKSNNPDSYPDGGAQSNCWYEKVN